MSKAALHLELTIQSDGDGLARLSLATREEGWRAPQWRSLASASVPNLVLEATLEALVPVIVARFLASVDAAPPVVPEAP